jgi:hypothetical protein
MRRIGRPVLLLLHRIPRAEECGSLASGDGSVPRCGRPPPPHPLRRRRSHGGAWPPADVGRRSTRSKVPPKRRRRRPGGAIEERRRRIDASRMSCSLIEVDLFRMRIVAMAKRTLDQQPKLAVLGPRRTWSPQETSISICRQIHCFRQRPRYDELAI